MLTCSLNNDWLVVVHAQLWWVESKVGTISRWMINVLFARKFLPGTSCSSGTTQHILMTRLGLYIIAKPCKMKVLNCAYLCQRFEHAQVYVNNLEIVLHSCVISRLCIFKIPKLRYAISDCTNSQLVWTV